MGVLHSLGKNSTIPALILLAYTVWVNPWSAARAGRKKHRFLTGAGEATSSWLPAGLILDREEILGRRVEGLTVQLYILGRKRVLYRL
jgi:hypothetical protein